MEAFSPENPKVLGSAKGALRKTFVVMVDRIMLREGDIMKHYSDYRTATKHFSFFARSGVFEEYFELFEKIIFSYVALQEVLNKTSLESREKIGQEKIGMKPENIQPEILQNL